MTKVDCIIMAYHLLPVVYMSRHLKAVHTLPLISPIGNGYSIPPRLLPLCSRSALDELAGRGGRGPEDDPLRLSARGLMQFLRARIREKSLAAAPADLLPASVICQVCDTYTGNSSGVPRIT